jgi:hypothetical protein
MSLDGNMREFKTRAECVASFFGKTQSSLSVFLETFSFGEMSFSQPWNGGALL